MEAETRGKHLHAKESRRWPVTPEPGGGSSQGPRGSTAPQAPLLPTDFQPPQPGAAESAPRSPWYFAEKPEETDALPPEVTGLPVLTPPSSAAQMEAAFGFDSSG